jgi:hypothetical protein
MEAVKARKAKEEAPAPAPEAKPDSWPLSLDGDAFIMLKVKFDRTLSWVLQKMHAYEMKDGQMTVKIDIGLETIKVPVTADGGEMRDSEKISFDCEIGHNIPIKGKTAVEVGGDGFEAIFDPVRDGYIMRRVESPQLDLFEQPAAAKAGADGTGDDDGGAIEMPNQAREVPLIECRCETAEPEGEAEGAEDEPVIPEEEDGQIDTGDDIPGLKLSPVGNVENLNLELLAKEIDRAEKRNKAVKGWFARTNGYDEEYMSLVLAGEMYISLSLLRDIAAALNVEPGYLLDVSDGNGQEGEEEDNNDVLFIPNPNSNSNEEQETEAE